MKAPISHAPRLSLKKSFDLTMNNSSLKCPTSAQYNTELMDRKQSSPAPSFDLSFGFTDQILHKIRRNRTNGDAMCYARTCTHLPLRAW